MTRGLPQAPGRAIPWKWQEARALPVSCEDATVKINHQVVVFDAAELAPESAFWAAVLQGTVEADDDWHMVVVDGEPRVGVQLAPDHTAPQWPDLPAQQIHLDLYVDDLPSAHQEVTALGATLLQEASVNGNPDDFQVYADPAGHPFCLCFPEPD
jgi:hypothetical protein